MPYSNVWIAWTDLHGLLELGYRLLIVAADYFSDGHGAVSPGKTGIGAKGGFGLGNDLVRRRRVVRSRLEHDQEGLGKMRSGLARIEKKSSVSPPHRPRIQIRTFVRRTESSLHRVDPSGARKRVGVVRIESQRSFKQVSRLVRRGFRGELVENRQTTHRQIDCVGISWPIVQATPGFRVLQLYLKRAREATAHFAQKFEQVRDIVLESIRPDLRVGFRVDQLRVDEHPVLIALPRAFEGVGYAEFFADRLGVEVSALKGEGGVAGNDETVVEVR